MSNDEQARLIMEFTNPAGLLAWVAKAREHGLLGPYDSVGVFETTEADRARAGAGNVYIAAMRGTTNERRELTTRELLT